jgi:predicted aldo/keto reductase-like oxidoreductase
MAKKFGFGCMRLPLLDKDDQTSFDYETINKLVDTFLEKGFTYFDTAYTYHSYRGEEAVREALVKRHNRDEFTLATKLPMRDIKTLEDQERIFNEQLENCGVTYFDYYLLHNMGVNAYKTACEFDSFSFGLKKKKEGKIKNFGMSFHDSPQLLDEILTAHPELDFVQLQINYIDWENPGIQSRRCHEVARKHNKSIIVMEPCKGGTLAIVPEKAGNLMKEYNPEASIPSWAIRFAASQEGVIMVLSGMNSTQQVLDNTSYMTDFKPLNEQEYKIISQVTEVINENTAIPDYFALYNSAKRATSTNFSSQFVYYLNISSTHGKAKDCIGCEQCEKACPQHLKITELLKDVSAAFDVTPSFPSRK